MQQVYCNAFHQPEDNKNLVKIRICCKCHKEIYDRFYLLADERSWHFDCLTCEKCCNTIASLGPTCFFKDGMVLCKNDYYKMKSALCTDCNESVHPQEYAHKIKIPSLPMNNSMNYMSDYSNLLIYHARCLKCFKCQNFLCKGEKYILTPDNMAIVCLKNECANDFRISPINSGLNQAPPTATRKRGRQSNSSSVKVMKAEKQ